MESYETNCFIANKKMYFYCRLWNPRAPFKFRPGISWGRMKQLQPVIYLHLSQWPPTPHSHYFHIVLLSRPLREGAESSSGALRDVQVLICALYSISTSRCVRNKPSRIPRRAAPRALHSIWSVRWCKMHRFFVLLYTRTVQVNAGRDQ